MISDALSECRAEIERYEREMPDAYAMHARELRVLKAILEDSRAWLDCPETPDGTLVNADYLRHLADWLDNPGTRFPEE